jgi:hypothetical protein
VVREMDGGWMGLPAVGSMTHLSGNGEAHRSLEMTFEDPWLPETLSGL